MERNKKSLLFVLIDILLTLVVGVVLGLCLPITENGAMLLSYILLLVTLLCPIPLFFASKNVGSPIGIASILFMVGNLVTMVVFMFTVKEIKVVGITEAAIVGVYLIIALIAVACSLKKE